ncbi:hypothetical protein ACKKBF_B11150 [Auxenochlorella protothecoides x Auxenochlorella symbiontica]
MSFDGLGLDPRLLRALNKLRLSTPTPVQSACIPVFLEGHDVVARARTGSGKTLAYLLPALHRILAGGEARAWQAVVLVPTRELCSQVLREGERLAAAAGQDLRVTALAGEGLPRSALSRAGQLVVTTPAKLALALSSGKLAAGALSQALQTLVLDEADLLLAYGYGEDMRGVAPFVPRACQCMLLSATSSSDVEALSKLVLHNPRTLDLLGAEAGVAPAGGVAAEVEHWRLDIPAHVPAGAETLERLLRTLALIRLGLVKRKILIFVNSVESGLRVRLFLEAFGVRAALVHSELPLNSRHHILQEFNRGLFDILVATDDVHAGEKKEAKEGTGRRGRRAQKQPQGPAKDEEFGVTRGIDFKGVNTVINFDMPASTQGYVHRLGRTGRAGEDGFGISIVGPSETELAASIEEMLAGGSKKAGESGEEEAACEPVMKPYTKLTAVALEGLRYRGTDVARSLTKRTIIEAQTKELKHELLNSQRLSAFFEEHPADLQLLQHDRPLASGAAVQAPHLKHLPAYLRDPTITARSNIGNSAGVLPERKRRKVVGIDPVKGFMRAPKRGGDEREEPTELELKAEKYGKKHRKKAPPGFIPKANVRKGKVRKR